MTTYVYREKKYKRRSSEIETFHVQRNNVIAVVAAVVVAAVVVAAVVAFVVESNDESTNINHF